MARFELEKTLGYDAEDLMGLVSNVTDYPHFVPFLNEVKVGPRREHELEAQFDAEVKIGYKFFSEKFSTRVTTKKVKKAVTMELLRGPFRHLHGIWTFEPVENGTIVRLSLNMEISNPLINAVFQANYERISEKLMAIFEQRAQSTLKPLPHP